MHGRLTGQVLGLNCAGAVWKKSWSRVFENGCILAVKVCNQAEGPPGMKGGWLARLLGVSVSLCYCSRFHSLYVLVA